MPLGIVTTLLRGRLMPGKSLTALTTKRGPIGFYEGKSTGLPTRFCSQIWPNGGGTVHKLAKVDDSVTVDSGAVVHAHAMIGLHSHICSGSVVGSHVILGSHSEIGCNVSLHNCSLGSSCILHSGVCIGQDGFGFKINDMGEVVKKPQLLRVQIGSNVEIGANSCIDRGRLEQSGDWGIYKWMITAGVTL